MDTLPLPPVIAGGIIFLSRRYCAKVKQNDDNVQFFALQHEPSRVVGINFRHAESDLEINQKPSGKFVPVPTTEEKKGFFTGLKAVFPQAAVLSSIFPQEKSSTYAVAKTLPAPLTALFKPCYLGMGAEDLLEESERIFRHMSITSEEAEYLTLSTNLQSKSLVWFEHRKGRITASVFGAVCRTSLSNPSQSLINRILQVSTPPPTASIQWGIENEERARSEYKAQAMNCHANLELRTTGLHVNPRFPHLGASPDGLVSCSCCGKGLLEIKCPFSIRNGIPLEAPCLLPHENNYKLNRAHEYFYQVQGQLAVVERDYCDFVIWTPNGIYNERIYPEPAFFFTISKQLDDFFIKIILPKLLTNNKQ